MCAALSGRNATRLPGKTNMRRNGRQAKPQLLSKAPDTQNGRCEAEHALQDRGPEPVVPVWGPVGEQREVAQGEGLQVRGVHAAMEEEPRGGDRELRREWCAGWVLRDGERGGGGARWKGGVGWGGLRLVRSGVLGGKDSITMPSWNAVGVGKSSQVLTWPATWM